MDVSEENLHHYMMAIDAMTRAETDTEKFGALLVVSHLLKDKLLSDKQNKELFKAIGSSFLCRLLLSDDNGVDVPDDCPQNIYQTIGVSIVSSFFLKNPEVIDTKTYIQLLSSMALILKLLKNKEIDLCEDEKQMLSDIIECFDCFFSSEQIKTTNFQTINRLFKTKFTEILVQIYSDERFAVNKSTIRQLLSKIAITIEWSDIEEQSFNEFMITIASECKSNQQKLRFDLCLHLSAILDKNHKYFEKQSNNPSVSIISDIIFQTIQNKLNKQLRDPVIKLASILTQIYNGFQWIHLPSKTWSKDKAKKFMLLLRLSCIEIAMTCDAEDIDLNCLANSFVILEHSVITLTNDSEEMFLLKHLSSDEIYDILTAIKDTMSIIIRYLQNFRAKDIQLDTESNIFVSILASIRVLSIWAAEETEALREEVADILPLIVKTFIL
ncbi:neurochondrin homolog [Oppia nitens]|uniref:neurochondrin homolog n=1 Tax=Oppia nitens TaxID=1686743 RepID=UPI0023DBDDB5|nr:neurochondrin homolog [Oppia nitens]